MQACLITLILLSVCDKTGSSYVTCNSVLFSRLGHCKILCKHLGLNGDLAP